MGSCIAGVEISRRVKEGNGNKQKTLILGSLFLGLTFGLTYFFVAASVDLPFTVANFPLYMVSYYVLVSAASYMALSMAQFNVSKKIHYIAVSIVITLSIVIADSVGFYILFNELIKVTPIFLVVTILLTLGTSLSLFRFLIQITNEQFSEVAYKWKFFGCCAAGMGLAGIPYIVLVSLVDFQSFNEAAAEPYLFLSPFIFVIGANLLLMLVPDIYGDQILLRSTTSVQSLFNHNPLAVFSIDLSGKIIDVNEQAEALTGYSKNELLTMTIRDFFTGSKKERIRPNVSSIVNGVTTNIETQIHKKSGEKVFVRITATRTIMTGKLIGVYGIVEDITESKNSKKTIEYLAYHDELTGLPNRRMVKQIMKKQCRQNSAYDILIIDFDRFKRINDSFGHSFGDQLLVEVGEKLEHISKGKITLLARLSGDEFLILTEKRNGKELSKIIVEYFKNPMSINGIDLVLSASIGIASYPEHSTNMDELHLYADLAMCESKTKGGNCWTKYQTEFSTVSESKLSLEHDLRKAIENQDLVVYYQPKYNLNNSVITGAEALLRWNHPDHGFISPGVFIPIAEETKLIVPLERDVILKVCKQLAQWKKQKIELDRVSINLSIESIFQEDFIDYILKILKKYDIKGSALEFEITERIVMRNEEYVNSTLQKMRNLGIEISIDDFGTGYSSLSYLHKLHVDVLKIDQSFISNIAMNKAIISAVLSMAKSLDLKVIAEGVETKEQLEMLQLLGCEVAQGFYFSRPVPTDQFEELMQPGLAVS
ncbi:sensor domain-containing protein [Jeotgalibacillus campisalis]|uniref:sensor domain-containing protein n=1 Tax=Jeotgalibacillus campisalis TaxID=220754 RepID=UPI000AC6B893|nr:EAL domain-containing protein [Jeotgalibacillus campisalis]